MEIFRDLFLFGGIIFFVVLYGWMIFSWILDKFKEKDTMRSPEFMAWQKREKRLKLRKHIFLIFLFLVLNFFIFSGLKIFFGYFTRDELAPIALTGFISIGVFLTFEIILNNHRLDIKKREDLIMQLIQEFDIIMKLRKRNKQHGKEEYILEKIEDILKIKIDQ